MRKTGFAILFLLAAAWLGCHEPTAPRLDVPRANASYVPVTPTLIDLGTPAGTYCDDGEVAAALAVNNRGQVVGDLCTADGHRHAFLWEDGALTDLGTLTGDGGESNANHINEAGQVLGNSKSSTGEWHTVLWQNGAITDLDAGLAPSSHDAKLNERGQVAGNRWSEQRFHPFFWNGSTFIDIPDMAAVTALNNQGQVAGYVVKDGIQQAAIWDAETGTTVIGLPSGTDWSIPFFLNDRGDVAGDAIIYATDGSIAQNLTWIWDAGDGFQLLPPLTPNGSATSHDMNNLGQVVGYGSGGAGQSSAIRWANGSAEDLGYLTPTSPWSMAYYVNDLGQVTGWSRDGESLDAPLEAFVWQDGMISPLPSHGEGSRPYGMSDAGHIVGTVTTTDHFIRPVLWTTRRQATPEEAVDYLMDQVTDLVDAGTLNGGQGQALLTKLGNVQDWLAAGNTRNATNVLNAFVNQVESFIADGTLSAEEGEPLIDVARAILAELP